MKTNDVSCWITGAALFGAGVFCSLHMNGAWPPVLMFIGCALICAPVGLLGKSRKEIFSLPMRKDDRPPEEPLFLAKLFLHMAWIARNFGILELCGTGLDKNYSHPLYWIGKSLVLDGMDPEYTLDSMRLATSHISHNVERKVQNARQAGSLLFFVGAFGGLAAAASYAARLWSGVSADTGSVCVTATLCFLLLMGSAILSLLVPARLRYERYQDRRLEQQIIYGWRSLQSGDSPGAIMRKQYLFLSPEHRKAIVEAPLLKELDESEMKKYRRTVWEDFRSAMKKMETELNMKIVDHKEGASS